MYKFKTSEQNNDKATEFETKSLLYMLIYSETIRTYSEDEKRLSELHDKQDALEAEIEVEQTLQDSNSQT